MDINAIIRESQTAATKSTTDTGEIISEVILTADGKEWQKTFIVRKPPKDAHRYIIINDFWTHHKSQTVRYDHYQNKQMVEIELRYRLKCPFGNAMVVAKAFHRATAARLVEERLARDCKRYLDLHFDNFIRHHAEGSKSLAIELSKSMLVIGLECELQAHLKIDSDSKITLIDLGQQTFRMADYDYDLKARIQFEVKDEEALKGLAAATPLDLEEIKATARRKILDYVAKQQLQDFLRFAMHPSDPQLCAILNEHLKLQGRRSDRIDVILDADLSQLLSNGLATHEVTIVANDLPGERKLGLKVSYHGFAKQDDYARVVRALNATRNYGLVDSWVREEVTAIWRTKLTDLRGFLTGFLKNPEQLETALNLALNRRAGLQFITKVTIDLVTFPPLRWHEQAMLARPSDMLKEYEIEYDATIEADNTDRAKGIAFGTDKATLQKTLEVLIREAVTSHVSLHALYLDNDKAARMVNEFLLGKLKEIGYLLTAFSMRALTKIATIQRFHREGLEIRLDIRGINRQMIIYNTIDLQLHDLGKFVRKDVGDIEGWVIESIHSVVKPILLSKDYATFVIDHDHYKKTIEDTIKAHFADAGYTVSQYIASPEIDFLSLQKDFRITETANFKTRHNAAEVSLEFIISAQIPKLEPIKHLINKPESSADYVKEVIKETARRKIAQILETKEAEQFYFYFDKEYVTDSGEKEMLRNVLTEALVKSLSGEQEGRGFGLQELNITLQFAHNRLRERFEELCKIPQTFEFIYQPTFIGAYADRITLEISYTIEGVKKEGWLSFSRHCQLEESTHRDQMNDAIKREVQPMLDLFDFSDLQMLTADERLRLVTEIGKVIVNVINDRFGLSAVFPTIRMKDIGGNGEFANLFADQHEVLIIDSLEQQKDDHKLALAENKNRRQKLQETLGKLRQRRYELMEQDASMGSDELADQEVARLKLRIEELETELKTLDTPARGPLQLPQRKNPALNTANKTTEDGDSPANPS